ncbi:MAG: hypothetical protein D6730_16605 [Bacteroidetes bacterium]|nr:MAG: hypothetical protein D6730_16605 [Bacteroidota bacterium]
MAIPGGKKRYTKENIKARMKQEAARIWQQQGTAMEGFDPLVELLMGACATELKKIYDEIASSQSRVLRRVAQLLTPDVAKGPIPAHAIMYARPVEPQHRVDREAQFYFVKKQDDQHKELFFSPVKEFPLHGAAITHFVIDNSLREKVGLDKPEVLRGSGPLPLKSTSLYMGIKADRELTSLHGLRFFFDWKIESEIDRQRYLRLLPATEWQWGKQLLDVQLGFGWEAAEAQPSLEQEFDVLHKAEMHILNRYLPYFLTLEDPQNALKPDEAGRAFPEEFAQAFSPEELAQFPPDCIWIKCTFPEVFPIAAFEHAFIELNCFPVMNRRLHTFPYRLQQHINIVPLETDAFFFSIKEVENDHGQALAPTPSIHLREGQKNTYSLRQGGTARYDVRDAAAMLDYVFDLLRDESAAFKALGYDVLASDIKSLNQIISRLERKIDPEKANKESITYLVIRPGRAGENVRVAFWDTYGAAANNLPTGTVFTAYRGADFPRGGVMLVSRSQGGRDPLDPKESLHAYRDALLSRGRIVSPADVRAVCFSVLGSRLKQVEVRKGVSVGDSPTQGLIRTLDVVLTPGHEGALSPDDCEELKTILESRSTGILPFRVFLGND